MHGLRGAGPSSDIFDSPNIFFDIYQGHKFFIFTVPKSGTHLLKKCVTLITGQSCKHTHIDYDFSVQHREILLKNKVKGLTVIRDPRDWFISFFRAFRPHRMSFDEVLTRALSGFGDLRYNHGRPLHHKDHLRYRMSSDFFKQFLMRWLDNYPDLYVARFEKLVGPKGGGTKAEQAEEIMNIAQYLGKNITLEEAESIGARLFGGTQTFRVGKFGYWKESFTDQHKALFKKDMGDRLIRWGYEKDSDW